MMLSLLSWFPCIVVSSWFMAETRALLCWLSCDKDTIPTCCICWYFERKYLYYLKKLHIQWYLTIDTQYQSLSKYGTKQFFSRSFKPFLFSHWLIVILCQNRKNIHRIYTIVIYFMFKGLLLIIIHMYICMCMHSHPLVLKGDWYQDHPPTPP